MIITKKLEKFMGYRNYPFFIKRILYFIKFPLRVYGMFKLNNKIIAGNSFTGFHSTGLLFVHIPKCAGISLNYSLYANKGGGHKPIYEYKLFFSKKTFANLFKFAVVRNPWSRLFSAYNFLKKGGRNKWDKEFASQTINKYPDFESFVLNWINHENIYIGIHFVPQFEFLCDSNGELIVDYIAKFENLENEYENITKKSINPKMSPKLEKMNLTNISQTYKDFYSTEMIEHVRNVYAKDIYLLKYSF